MIAEEQTQQIHVLYIDDEQHNLNSFTATFRKSFRIFTTGSLEAAENICSNNNIHVVIIDQYILNRSGNELVFFAAKYIHQTRILLTGFADENYLESAIRDKLIYRYFQKPWDEIKLRNAIEDSRVIKW